jgi:hypothetical protein
MRYPVSVLLCFLISSTFVHLGAQGESPSATGDAAAALAKLEAAYRKAKSEHARAAAAQRALRAEDPKAKLPPLVHPDPEYAAKFREAAARYAGSEEAAGFLIEALRLSYRRDVPAAKEILDQLLDDHVKSYQLSGITSILSIGKFYLGDDTVRTAMTRIIDGSPHDTVKVAFLYARGALATRSDSVTDAERAAAIADLDRALQLGPTSIHAEMAKAAKHELQNLQIGMPAPDIEGKDLDGVAFKLSDYRGKVVVLDFWGDW